MRSAVSKMSCRLCEMITTARPCSAETPDQGEHLLCLGDAERGRRLVEDHELRVPHARPARRRPTGAGRRRGSRPAAGST